MHYPWWYVPYLTAPMLIAVISVAHVLVSHYAVGGGLFLAVEVGHAYRTKNRAYLDYLHRHAAFFILLTVVFGAITGVAIWWTIGLASPLATEVLIRTFVFGWATEWVFFVVEMIAAFIFLYYWGRLSEKIHTAIGWIYALAAWISLVLITGITAFMQHPGNWLNDHNFWTAFLNPQFLPQTIARTGVPGGRLTALRSRVQGYRVNLPRPLPEAQARLLSDVFTLLARHARKHREDFAAVRSELACWSLEETEPRLAGDVLAQHGLDELREVEQREESVRVQLRIRQLVRRHRLHS